MSNTKHTPGPWTTPDAYPNAIQVTSASGWICSLEVNKFNATEEQKANARLIKQAPDLLDICESILAEVDYEGLQLESGRVAKLRAVIAKATAQ